jgi:hypothetical protein
MVMMVMMGFTTRKPTTRHPLLSLSYTHTLSLSYTHPHLQQRHRQVPGGGPKEVSLGSDRAQDPPILAPSFGLAAARRRCGGHWHHASLPPTGGGGGVAAAVTNVAGGGGGGGLLAACVKEGGVVWCGVLGGGKGGRMGLAPVV